MKLYESYRRFGKIGLDGERIYKQIKEKRTKRTNRWKNRIYSAIVWGIISLSSTGIIKNIESINDMLDNTQNTSMSVEKTANNETILFVEYVNRNENPNLIGSVSSGFVKKKRSNEYTDSNNNRNGILNEAVDTGKKKHQNFEKQISQKPLKNKERKENFPNISKKKRYDLKITYPRYLKYKELFIDLERYYGFKRHVLVGVAYNESRIDMNRVSKGKGYGVSQSKEIAYKEVAGYERFKEVIKKYEKNRKLRIKNPRTWKRVNEVYIPFVKAVEREKRMYGWEDMPSFEYVKKHWRTNIVIGSLYYYLAYLETKNYEINGRKVVNENDAEILAYLLYNKGLNGGKKILEKVYNSVKPEKVKLSDVLNYLPKNDEAYIGMSNTRLWILYATEREKKRNIS